MTKHANVEVGGQSVKTCLIKHRWNNWYKPLSKRGTHARFKHVWCAAVQTYKTSPIKQENKRNALRYLIKCLMAFKFYLTRPNTTNHDKTRSGKRWKGILLLGGLRSKRSRTRQTRFGHRGKCRESKKEGGGEWGRGNKGALARKPPLDFEKRPLVFMAEFICWLTTLSPH